MEDLKPGRKKKTTGAKLPYRRKYSVYHKDTDQPLIVYASAKECAAAMGIKTNSFYRYICRMRGGKIKLRKWQVYLDSEEEL